MLRYHKSSPDDYMYVRVYACVKQHTLNVHACTHILCTLYLYNAHVSIIYFHVFLSIHVQRVVICCSLSQPCRPRNMNCVHVIVVSWFYSVYRARAVCTSEGRARGSTYSTMAVLSNAL